MGDWVLNHIIPTAVSYQQKLISNAKGLEELGINNSETKKVIKEINNYMHIISTEVSNMIEERKRINKIENTREKAIEYCDNIKENILIL